MKNSNPPKYIRSANNRYGEQKKACYAGDYNITFDGEEPYIHIYVNDEELLCMKCYKNPYLIAKAILGNPKYEKIIKDIKYLMREGFEEGYHFVVTEKGVSVKPWMLNK